MKNFHLDLVRVTEAGAIAAASWVGRGNKEAADRAATDAMRDRLNQIDFFAEIAIGEGIKDKSVGLYKGEAVGSNRSVLIEGKNYTCNEEQISETIVGTPEYSIAVDPIEGTTPVSKGGYEAMSVIAMANYGCLFKTDAFYMNKFAVGPKIANYVRKTYSNTEPIDLLVGLEYNLLSNLSLLSKALDKPFEHLTVCVLDRPRHAAIIDELRRLKCRIKFITDCDVTACIATCDPDSGIDMYVGVGGAPEAVISAAAVKCMGGIFQAQIADNGGMVVPDANVHTIEDLAQGDVMFCATGITDGQLLKGVKFTNNGVITHTIAMRSESGTVRRIATEHGN